ncbi:MAG: PAS domain-containing protein [Deltaproteobacteria bacterium]
MQPNWINELPVGITVCDPQGIILSMNDRAALIFKKSGGRELVGRNLLDCHPEETKQKIRDLLETKKPNAYTVEKNGVKTLLYQAPWFEGGTFMGYVEFILTLPEQMAELDKINWVK